MTSNSDTTQKLGYFESVATNLDRIVYAERPGVQLVRYERAGKWYEEFEDGSRHPCNLAYAVDRALELEDEGGVIYLRQMGGTMFDAKVRKARG